MPDDIATALLDLVSQAENLTDPTGLRTLLAQAHPLWCHALEDVRTHIRNQAAGWNDEQLVEHATAEGIQVAPSASRDELLQDLVFERFDATPAALAYQTLAERAHAHHTGLID
ncbi:hypothetical protein [Streptacidiphilus neutrinimicus]|uniref:hypothetical protein n=1 Tax=Streptacidiphilus neutrinimicus TaxID=105420 RepID=UPI0005AB53DE|nr:hypothetical protein [Streptacidiphilus neutrinimicus]